MDKKNQSRRAFLRTSIASGASLAAVGLHAAPVGIYQPGTYSAKASGIGDVVVTMTFDSNKITDVVLDVSHETPNIGQAAAKQLRQSLLKAQSADIDAVSEASITSQAVHKAAAKCIAQAKGDVMKAFFRNHPRIRCFAIAGAIGACCYLFWFLVLYVPYYCGWVMMPVN